ncbi:hypothetical protein, partial [Vulcanococcus sp.]|uniref:hypothetical protein n=1 Tax=Vulcanococcus sp. TaxID=2856995 RepID=UPI0037D9AF45
NEAVALEPVIEDVEPSPLRRAPYSDRHESGFMKRYTRTVRATAGVRRVAAAGSGPGARK